MGLGLCRSFHSLMLLSFLEEPSKVSNVAPVADTFTPVQFDDCFPKLIQWISALTMRTLIYLGFFSH